MNNYYFKGEKVSDYGVQHGFVDYRCLAKSMQAILCNDITKIFYDEKFGEAEFINGDYGYYDDEDGLYYEHEVFQWYIIDENSKDTLETFTDEIVYYIPGLNIYVWGVTHFGTAWDYVLTNIPLDRCYNYNTEK